MNEWFNGNWLFQVSHLSLPKHTDAFCGWQSLSSPWDVLVDLSRVFPTVSSNDDDDDDDDGMIASTRFPYQENQRCTAPAEATRKKQKFLLTLGWRRSGGTGNESVVQWQFFNCSQSCSDYNMLLLTVCICYVTSVRLSVYQSIMGGRLSSSGCYGWRVSLYCQGYPKPL